MAEDFDDDFDGIDDVELVRVAHLFDPAGQRSAAPPPHPAGVGPAAEQISARPPKRRRLNSGGPSVVGAGQGQRSNGGGHQPLTEASAFPAAGDTPRKAAAHSSNRASSPQSVRSQPALARKAAQQCRDASSSPAARRGSAAAPVSCPATVAGSSRPALNLGMTTPPQALQTPLGNWNYMAPLASEKRKKENIHVGVLGEGVSVALSASDTDDAEGFVYHNGPELVDMSVNAASRERPLAGRAPLGDGPRNFGKQTTRTPAPGMPRQQRESQPSSSLDGASLASSWEAGQAPNSSSISTPHRRTTNAGSFRQTTLLQGALPLQVSPSQSKALGATATAMDEPPTHHQLDFDALNTWVYPMNLGAIRDYQYNIVQKGLFHNLLVALPTGLGKTFIAATIMLNWFRWTKTSQIVFVAPTKPLVAQQVDACFKIVGIPRSETTLLTGATSPGLRADEWASKRVFFMTPQTLVNDLKRGICDPKRIVCVVVDEAHRATGSFAYVEVIKFIRRFNPSFRVLALTATPGSSVETVQEVIDGLDIARVEIRTEESLDIRQYVQTRNIETVVFDPSDEIIRMRELYSEALQPLVNELTQANAYWGRDPMALTAFGLTQARVQWMNSAAGQRASFGLKGKMNTIFTILASLAHAISLLNYHGIGPFYQYLVTFRSENEGGEKGSKYKKQILESPPFRTLMDYGRAWTSQPDFVGHPKLSHLRQVVLNHFLDADSSGQGQGGGEGEPAAAAGTPSSATRIMIFVQYRDSAEEIVRVLKQNEPLVRPQIFVGQATARSSAGMNQKTQLAVMERFKRGAHNTLVATCVGEEGLDIGEVDLIVCYDSSASPIRMLQRMGRTGRKRAGRIVLLLLRGKEEDSYSKAKDAYARMQEMIASGARFTFHDDLSPRILPRDARPLPDKRAIEIPVENSQGDLPEPTPQRRGRAAKRAPPKKFHMPDGVETGFVTASRLHGGGGGDGGDGDGGRGENRPAPRQPTETELAEVPDWERVVLTPAQKKELHCRYQLVYGDDEPEVVGAPRLDAFPALQRSLRSTKYVGHSRLTLRTVQMLNAMHDVDEAAVRAMESRSRSRGPVMSSAWDRRLASGSAESPSRSCSPHHSPPSAARGHLIAQSSASLQAENDDSDNEDDDDDDDDDDLGSFIASDGEEEDVPGTSSTSPPSSPAAPKYFYNSQDKTYQQSQEAEDLPDVSMLVGGGADSGPPARGGHGCSTAAPKAAPGGRKRRRILVEESSDEME